MGDKLLPGQQFIGGASNFLFGTNTTDYDNSLVTNPSVANQIKAIKVPIIRCALEVNGSTNLTDAQIDALYNAVTGVGAKMLAILRLHDLAYSQHCVQYLGNRCMLYEIGNEPDLGGISVAQYRSYWSQLVPACRAINPNAAYIGPVLGDCGSNYNYILTFMDNCKADNILPDGISYHVYPCTSKTRIPQATCSTKAPNIATTGAKIRNDAKIHLGYIPAICCTEYNADAWYSHSTSDPGQPAQGYNSNSPANDSFNHQFMIDTLESLVSNGIDMACHFELGYFLANESGSTSTRGQYTALQSEIQKYLGNGGGGGGGGGGSTSSVTVSPTSLSFSGAVNGTGSGQNLTVTNTGNASGTLSTPITYSAYSSLNWITVSVSGGNTLAAGASTTLLIGCAPQTGMPAGTYTATIAVTVGSSVANVSVTLTVTSVGSNTAMHILAPAYSSPTDSNGSWAKYESAGSAVGFIVANPNSGPGTAQSQTFTNGIAAMHAAGIKVLGYVWTNTATVSIASVENQIDQWYSWYPTIDGIHLDDCLCTSGNYSYYQTLYNYIKGKSSTHNYVFLNPAIVPPENYMQILDTVLVYENTLTNLNTNHFTSQAYMANYPSSKFAATVVGMTNAATVDGVMNQFRAANIGFVFLTDQTGASPYFAAPNDTVWNETLKDLGTASTGGAGNSGNAKIQAVATAVLTNMYTNAWNTRAWTKQANGTYNASGGLYINYEQAINWSAFSTTFDVNQSSISSSSALLTNGGTTINQHDPQCCLQYLRCAALYRSIYGSTSFDASVNSSSKMGISDMTDHVLLDFVPQTQNGATSGYNNPKGWVYFAILDIYLNLNSTSVISSSQKNALQQSLLWQAWSYYNNFYNSTEGILCDTAHGTYQPSQSLLMSAALLDAATRFPSSITTGMFYKASGTDTNSVTNWQNAATTSANNIVNNRGAWSSSYSLFQGGMAIVAGGPDTPNTTTGKVGDEAEAAQALIRLSNLTGTTSYFTLAGTLLNSIESKCWDALYGGYGFSYNLTGSGSSNMVYKECRATAHMLTAYSFYDQISATYTAREAAITQCLTSNMYKSSGGGGYWYRCTGADPTFGVYHDTYTTPWSSTLSASASAGATSVTATSTATISSSETGPYTNLILDAHTANEEQIDAVYPPVSNVISLQSLYNGNGTLQKSHASGAAISGLSFPVTNYETQYTTEASAAVVAYLLLTQVGTSVGATTGTTPLSVYFAQATDSVLTSAKKLYTTQGSPSYTWSYSRVGLATGWGELTAFTNTNAWPALSSIGAQTGNGWFYDVSLAGNQLNAGNWSSSVRLNCALNGDAGNQQGQLTADITVRASKYNSVTHTYTTITSMTLTNQTITGSGATQAVTFQLPNALTSIATSFTLNEYLYLDVWVNSSSNTANSSVLDVRFNRLSLDTTNKTGDPNAFVGTPGFSSTASSGGNATITASTTAFTFSAVQGGSVSPAQPLILTNSGAVSGNWTESISYQQASGWLSLGTTSGSLDAGVSQTITLNCDPSGLVPGTYTASVVFIMAATSVNVAVTFTISSPSSAFLTVSPTFLNFSVTR